MTDERRMTDTDRRTVGRPRGGRRASDPIIDLATHGSKYVNASQLADYWGVHPYTINGFIRKGKLGAILIGGAYRIRVVDALHFERKDTAWTKRNELDTIDPNKPLV